MISPVSCRRVEEVLIERREEKRREEQMEEWKTRERGAEEGQKMLRKSGRNWMSLRDPDCEKVKRGFWYSVGVQLVSSFVATKAAFVCQIRSYRVLCWTNRKPKVPKGYSIVCRCDRRHMRRCMLCTKEPSGTESKLGSEASG